MKCLPAIGTTLCILLSLLLFSFYNPKQYKPEWEILYKHNEKGQALQGSKQALIAAIRKGYDIKVGWGFQSAKDSSVRLEHIAIPHFLSIVKEQDVIAIIHEHGLLDSYLSDTPKIRIPVQVWRCVLSTKGTFNAIYYPEDGSAPPKDFPQRHIMTWFAQAPAVQLEGSRPLFSTNN